MNNYKLEIQNLSKKYGRRLVFSGVSGSYSTGEIIGIKGKNGSGKSTLSRILVGIDSQNGGKVNHILNGKILEKEDIYNFVGFAAPYLNLYSEFSAFENLKIFSKIRGIQFDLQLTERLFENFNLSKRKNDLLSSYSSGMLQRMKIIFSVIHKPNFLVLDEPISNLDSGGKSEVYQLIKMISHETLIFIASNEESDLRLCSNFIEIEEYKK